MATIATAQRRTRRKVRTRKREIQGDIGIPAIIIGIGGGVRFEGGGKVW
jgi:hypothetical protein